MACVALPFAAEAALVRAQLQQGVELAVVWALKAGLLEVRASFASPLPASFSVMC